MTQVNLIIFGIGNVGATLINQLIAFKAEVKQQQQIDLRIPVMANSKFAFFNSDDLNNTWTSAFDEFSVPYNISKIVDFVKNKYQNVIVVDATASKCFVENYEAFIKSGFHIAAANKVANTLDYDFYKTLRETLKTKKKQFYYETNVGAGLPIIETVKTLQVSGDKISKIRGVFSGSLSYIFNRFSEENVSFSDIVKDASKHGYTEPDVRDDLSGKDVARKLLILAREIGFQFNLEDVEVDSLVPSQLNGNTTLSEFNSRITELDKSFQTQKEQQTSDVLRYVGELDTETLKLKVSLVSEPKSTPLGQLKNADNLFEIYSNGYQNQPLVIQGAGAGKEVTARGLFSDILKMAKVLQ